jgi:uncharacterized membrane protein YdbT with pleckstrin-like domain
MRNPFWLFKESHNSFEQQENGEKVVMLLRRHPITIFLKLLVFVLMFGVPFFVGDYFSSFLYANNLLPAALFIFSVYSMLVWLAAFKSLAMYALDVWIVTDRRVLDSKQHGFFNRTTSELHLSRIQDISVETHGVIQTFFKFGDLHIQTAGTEERFTFLQIPHPERARGEIIKLSHPQNSSNLG